jgi:hypothetical protein
VREHPGKRAPRSATSHRSSNSAKKVAMPDRVDQRNVYRDVRISRAGKSYAFLDQLVKAQSAGGSLSSRLRP